MSLRHHCVCFVIIVFSVYILKTLLGFIFKICAIVFFVFSCDSSTLSTENAKYLFYRPFTKIRNAHSGVPYFLSPPTKKELLSTKSSFFVYPLQKQWYIITPPRVSICDLMIYNILCWLYAIFGEIDDNQTLG